jgi:hypothetical protein
VVVNLNVVVDVFLKLTNREVMRKFVGGNKQAYTQKYKQALIIVLYYTTISAGY